MTTSSLPFDQFSRQMTTLEVINSVRSGNQSFEILDIGGYKGATRKVHKQDNVTVLDVFGVKQPGYVKGDATKLTFKDNSFDFVVSFDVLEHIKPDKRDAVINEAVRVSKLGVIFANPVSEGENEDVENSLNKLYRKIHGQDHPWLKEHIEYGIPKKDYVVSRLKNKRMNAASVGSNNTSQWVQMQTAIFIAAKHPAASKNIKKLNAHYNKLGLDIGSSGNYYRQIAIGMWSDIAINKAVNRLKQLVAEDAHSYNNTCILLAEYYDSSLASLHADFEEQLLINKKVSKQREQELALIKNLQERSARHRIAKVLEK